MLKEIKNNKCFLRKGNEMFRKINVMALFLVAAFGLYPNYDYAQV